jgi:hypothetical protein
MAEMTTHGNDFLEPFEVGDLLKVSERSLSRWHRRRIGPPRIKVGRKVFYRRDALWLAANEEQFPSALQQLQIRGRS